MSELEEIKQQKNQAYSERNKVVAALAGLLSTNWPQCEVGVAIHDANDKDWEDDWRTILVIELPNGQVTWHFHDSERYLLAGLPKLDSYKWDGHSTDEKYKRLLEFCALPKNIKPLS